MFMLTGGVSVAIGMLWFDTYDSIFGLAMALMLIAYALVCFGFAYRCIFWRKRSADDRSVDD